MTRITNRMHSEFCVVISCLPLPLIFILSPTKLPVFSRHLCKQMFNKIRFEVLLAKQPNSSNVCASTCFCSRESRNLAEKNRREKLNGLVQSLTQYVPHVRDSPRRVDKTGVLRYAAHGLRLQYGESKSKNKRFLNNNVLFVDLHDPTHLYFSYQFICSVQKDYFQIAKNKKNQLIQMSLNKHCDCSHPN